MDIGIFALLEAIFEFFGLALQVGSCAILNWAISVFVGGNITVSPDYLYSNLFIGVDIVSFKRAFIIAGAILTIVLLTLSILRHGLGSLLETKDSILQTFFRFGVCIFMTTFIYVGFDYIYALSQSVMESAFQEEVDDNGSVSYFGLSALPDSDTSLLVFVEKFSKTNSLNDPNFAVFDGLLYFYMETYFIHKFLLAAVRSIFFIIMAYNYIKLCIELMKRYVTMSALYLVSPPFTAFFISAETQIVTLSFFKLFGTTVMVFCFSKIWIFLSAYVLAHANVSFVNMFAVIAFISFGMRIENIFKEIGLSTANLGGALLDNVVMTTGAIAHAAKGLTRGTGGGLINARGLGGNMNLVAAGSALTGRSLAPDKLAATVAGSADGVMREKLSSSVFPQSNFTSSIAKNLDDVFRTGGISRNYEADKILNNLNPAGKEEAFKAIMNSQYGSLSNMLTSKGFTASNQSYDPIKGFTMSLTGQNGLSRQVSISTSPSSGPGVTSYGFKDSNGRVSYLNMDSPWEQFKDKKNSGDVFRNNAGETISTSNQNGMLTSSEFNTGVRYAPFVQKDGIGKLDLDATHYEQKVNQFGNIDIYYGHDPDNRELVGTSTIDGIRIYSGNGHDRINKPEDVATMTGSSEGVLREKLQVEEKKS